MAVGYGTRTYKPGLLIACKIIRGFIVRNQVKLEQNLTPAGYTLLLSILDAVNEMISALSDPLSPDVIE